MFSSAFKVIFFFFFFFQGFFSVYAQNTSNVVIKEFKIIGNKTTHESIIVREIPVNVYDTIPTENLKDKLEWIRSNLLNTSLFNFVTVEPVYFDDKNISIFITVEERWYWWPIPIFEIQETNFNTWWLDKNFNRVNYGMSLSKENFRGRKERLSFLLQNGYTEKAGVKYSIPYINKKKTNGISVMFSYSRNREISYDVSNNVRDFYRLANEYVQKEVKSSIGYEFRPKLYNKHNFNVDYTDVSVADSVLNFNENYLLNSDNQMRYFSAKYSFKWDKRNFRNYPTTGSYVDFKFFKHGLGVLSDVNSFYLTSHYKKFWQLSNNIYFASSAKTKLTLKDAPYYLLNGFAFGNDLVRGYELYVVNADNYGLVKFQLRYSLLKDKVFNVNAIRFEKFKKIPLNIYAGAYFDAGYSELNSLDQNNSLSNTTLYGGGVSLDFVSYYDLVLRVEYSINKMKEKGLFLHFIAPI
ncbi:MAG: BamA/TamA family outer membrane protein [Vicingaceae bacterium]|nr:BamA/TamA family outer membrane protein [Vicingaceae bacterium]